MTKTMTNTHMLLTQATTLLSKDQEQALFQELAQAKMDRDKWLIPPRKLTLNESSQLAAAKRRVKALTDELVRANLPLIIRVAKYFAQPGIDEERLVSEGLLKLLQCIDGFNAEYGFKFSTYLQRPLYRHFTRFIKKETKRNWGKIDNETVFKTETAEAHENPEADELLEVLNQNTAGLDPQEKVIITRAYGIGRKEGPMNLKQLRAEFGLSNARLKRIIARSKDKLRVVLMEDLNETE